jgi:DNA-binding MarR family transcriptional regulator
MVDRLQEAGLVERRPDPADRRAWKLYLTEPARPLLDQLRQLGAVVIEEALSGFSPPQRESLYGGLTALRSNLSSRGPIIEPDAPRQERA